MVLKVGKDEIRESLEWYVRKESLCLLIHSKGYQLGEELFLYL